MEISENSPLTGGSNAQDGVLAILDSDGGGERILTREEAIRFHMEALEELAEPHFRSDGWTPYARKLFLQVLAQTGRVNRACETCCLTKQSAYYLRNRDPVFAAGWDAAAALARMTLADELMDRAIGGVTETVMRDGQVVGERHRYDNRLSIAVLNRLDKRCDRAEVLGAGYLGAVANWDKFIRAVGDDDQDGARALLEEGLPGSASDGQASQEMPTDEAEERPEKPRIWWENDTDEWRTDYPPPPGFDGHMQKQYGEWGFSRSLSDAERRVIDEEDTEEQGRRRIEDERRRYSYFGPGQDEPDPSPGLPEAVTDPMSSLERAADGQNDECVFLDDAHC